MMSEAFTLIGVCFVGAFTGALVAIGIRYLLTHKPKP